LHGPGEGFGAALAGPETVISEGAGQAGSEPVTFMLRGRLIALEGGLYGIQDADGVETTILAKKGTTIHGNPKVGDQVEVEYLENGTALVVIVISSTPGFNPKPRPN